MPKNYLKFLNVESSEQTIVLLLLLQSVFVGIFYGSFSIGSETLFTGAFEPNMISRALFVSGILGIIFTMLYSFLQSRMRFGVFSIINLIFVVGLTVLSRLGFGIIPEKWLIFILFIIFGPLHIVAQVAFWGTATRIFSLRQGKRLFGLIDTGWAVGIIIMTLVNLILLQFNFETKNLLFFSILSIIGALFLQTIIVRFINTEETPLKSTKKEKSSQISFAEMFKDKYISSIILFVILSVMVLVFIYTSFLSVSQDKYPDESNRGQFFSAVLLTVMVFSILLKTFAYDNLMKTYGLKIGIMLTPIVIGIFAVLTSIIGSFGYTPEAELFTFFFLMIALSRMLSFSLNYSIEKPSSKLLYQSIKKVIRFDVQSKIDGTINEISFLASGLIILLIGLLSFIEIIHYSWLLVIIVGVWVYAGIRLHRQYKFSLERSLEESDSEVEQFHTNDHNSKIMDHIKNNELDFLDKIESVNLLKTIDPFTYEEALIELFKSDSEIAKKYAVKEISNMQLISSKDVLTKLNYKTKSKELKDFVDTAIKNIDEQQKKIQKGSKHDSFLKSDLIGDRIFLSRYLSVADVYDSKRDSLYLSALLRDVHPNVRLSAMKTVAYLNTPEHIASVVDSLVEKSYYNVSYKALSKIGKPTLELLEQLYNKSDINIVTQNRIVKLYGEIGGDKAVKYLVDKLNSQNFGLLNQLAISLRQCDYQASERNRHIIYQAVHLVISVIAWNLSAQLSIEEEKIGDMLVDAIQEELEMNYNLLFQLLSIAYDPKSIDHVRENLESGTGEGIGFAIELLDIFVSDELKEPLTILLEDTPLPEKIRKLQVEFPVDKMDSKDLLVSLINRDINYISNWTKVCALYSFLNLKEEDLVDDIIAHLFNPDKLLYETAAFVVYQKDKEKFHSVISRVNPEVVEEIQKSINNYSISSLHLFVEKVLFFKKNPYFASLSGDLLSRIARLTSLEIFEGEKALEINKGDKELYIVIKGELELIAKEKVIAKFSKNEIVTGDYLDLIEEVALYSKPDTYLYRITSTNINELVFDYRELIPVLMNTNKN